MRSGLQQSALSKLGKDAIAVGPAEDDVWNKAVADIGGGLNNRIQDQFNVRVAHQYSMLDDTIRNHVEHQTRVYHTDTANALLQIKLKDAVDNYDNPSIVGQSLAESKDAVRDLGIKMGWSPEMVKEQTTEAASDIHTAVIDRMLTAGDDLTAQKYFNANTSELTAGAITKLNGPLEIGSIRGESQRRADAIVSQAATLGGALAQAAQITNPDGTPNPKLREETEGRIRRYYEDQAASDRFDKQQAYAQASAILSHNPDMNAIPPSMLEKLSAAEQIELRNLVNKRRNPERETDSDVYASLMNMAGLNDSTRQKFESLDLRQYHSQLSDKDYNRLLTLQLSERRQTGGALSGEAKRMAAIADRDAKKQKDREAAAQTLRNMGIEIPPSVPGAPLKGQSVQLKLSPKGKQVPQSWVDHASKDDNYKNYLLHMGVVFDSTGSTPSIK